MRKSLFAGVFISLLTLVLMYPVFKSGAAKNQQRLKTPTKPITAPLPNYDIRTDGRGEFSEHDLTSSAGVANAMATTATQPRVSAFNKYRAGLRPDLAAR